MTENIETFVTKIIANLSNYTIGDRGVFERTVSKLDPDYIDSIFTAINACKNVRLSEHEERKLAELVWCLATIQHDHMYKTYIEHPRNYIRKLLDAFYEELNFDLHRGSENDYWQRFEVNQLIDLGNKPYSPDLLEAKDFALNGLEYKKRQARERGVDAKKLSASVFTLKGPKLAVSLIEVNVYKEKEYRIKRGTKGVLKSKTRGDNGLHYYEIEMTGQVVSEPICSLITGTANEAKGVQE